MCDSLVAAPAQTAAGRTLYAKNSDRKPQECQPLVQHPAAHYPRGARLRCTHVQIPQVAETYRVLGHSPWWVWGFEHGVNEHAVAIGNHTVFSKEPLEERPGLIGMDLVRLGLERGRNAREALEVIAALLERHGQGGAALAPGAGGYHNSFVLADAREAWHLETSNRRWAARRVSLAAVSNHYCIADDWEIGSRDLERFAREAGWWEGPARLDVAAAYRCPQVPPHVSEGRQQSALQQLAEGAGRHDPGSFVRALRDHGAGAAAWTGGDATPAEARFFTVCAHSDPVHRTTASLVAELPRDAAAPWPVWVSFGTPCSGVFLPVYVDGVLPAELARGGAQAEADSAWWSFERLDAAASLDPVTHVPRLRAAWAPHEAALEADRQRSERAAREALAGGDPDTAAAQLSACMRRGTERVLAAAEQLAGELQAGAQAVRASS